MHLSLLLTILMALVHDVHSTAPHAAVPPPTKSALGVTAVNSQQILSQTPILMYHYVEYVKDARDTIRKSLDITPATFEKQIQTLQAHGYSFITMSDLGAALRGEKVLPRKSVILTFDDGYKDFFTDVFPILSKYHVMATAYIVPHFLGRPNYMAIDDVKVISQSGLVDIGAHTQDHIDLRRRSLAVLQKEIWGSKQDLESLLLTSVATFAYPYGEYDAQALSIVAQGGFSAAVGTTISRTGRFDQWTIERIRPGALVGEALIHYMERIMSTRRRAFSFS